MFMFFVVWSISLCHVDKLHVHVSFSAFLLLTISLAVLVLVTSLGRSWTHGTVVTSEWARGEER